MNVFLAETLGVGEHKIYVVRPGPPVFVVVDGLWPTDDGLPDAGVEFFHPDKNGIYLEWVCEEVEQQLGAVATYDLPEPTFEEYEALKASIDRFGVQQPVVQDEFGRTIAGRLRKRACEELGKSYPTITISNLTREQKKQLAFELDFCRKQIGLEAKRGIARALLTQLPWDSDRKIGRASGLDHKTVGSLRRELEAGGEIPRLAVHAGEDGKRYKVRGIIASTPKEQQAALEAIKDLPSNCAGKIVDTITAKRRARRNRKSQARAAAVIPPQLPDDPIRLFHCRFQDLEQIAGIAPASVSLVLTDIPYDQGFLVQLPDLAQFATRVLVDGGLFVTYSGTAYLNTVLRLLEDNGLTYRWVSASVWEGEANICHPRNVINNWLPILVFSKGEWRERRRWNDVLRYPKEKDWHEWQRPLGEVEALVRFFSEPGDLVVEPCGGGFTTAAACFRLGRRCVSCDIDADAVQRGLERLAMEKQSAADRKDA